MTITKDMFDYFNASINKYEAQGMDPDTAFANAQRDLGIVLENNPQIKAEAINAVKMLKAGQPTSPTAEIPVGQPVNNVDRTAVNTAQEIMGKPPEGTYTSEADIEYSPEAKQEYLNKLSGIIGGLQNPPKVEPYQGDIMQSPFGFNYRYSSPLGGLAHIIDEYQNAKRNQQMIKQLLPQIEHLVQKIEGQDYIKKAKIKRSEMAEASGGAGGGGGKKEKYFYEDWVKEISTSITGLSSLKELPKVLDSNVRTGIGYFSLALQNHHIDEIRAFLHYLMDVYATNEVQKSYGEAYANAEYNYKRYLLISLNQTYNKALREIQSAEYLTDKEKEQYEAELNLNYQESIDRINAEDVSISVEDLSRPTKTTTKDNKQGGIDEKAKKRLYELVNKYNNGKITPEENKELEELMKKYNVEIEKK